MYYANCVFVLHLLCFTYTHRAIHFMQTSFPFPFRSVPCRPSVPPALSPGAAHAPKRTSPGRRPRDPLARATERESVADIYAKTCIIHVSQHGTGMLAMICLRHGGTRVVSLRRCAQIKRATAVIRAVVSYDEDDDDDRSRRRRRRRRTEDLNCKLYAPAASECARVGARCRTNMISSAGNGRAGMVGKLLRARISHEE